MAPKTNQPNFLVIICDQLSALALSTYGNTFSRTPAIDSLAENGTVFEQAYCTSPLCQPSRASFWTSRYPFETRVDTNLRDLGFPAIAENLSTLGDTFTAGGYQAWHFGKEHDYGSLRGFTRVESVEREIPRDDPAINLAYETFLDLDTTAKVVDWLKSDTPQKQPFLTVADMQNPHNICFYIGENQEGCQSFQDNPELPELPDNFDTPDMVNRPEYIQYLCCAHRRLRHAAHWTPEDYRHYLYAYYHYLNRVDQQIGEILNTLDERNLTDNTNIVFMADHGEGMAAHHMVTKYGCFYEESLRVPFIFKGPDIPAGQRVPGVASLLDLKPTLQALAGLPQAEEDRGRDLSKCILESGRTPHTYIVSNWEDEFADYTVPGRMLCFDSLKYMAYRDYESQDSDQVTIHEELYDLAKDPGEQCTLIHDRAYADELKKARDLLAEHVRETGDPFYDTNPDYDRGLYRKHAPGFHNHSGLSAVEVHVSNRK